MTLQITSLKLEFNQVLIGLTKEKQESNADARQENFGHVRGSDWRDHLSILFRNSVSRQ